MIPLGAGPAMSSRQGVQVVDVATGLEERARVGGARRKEAGVDEAFTTAADLDLKLRCYKATKHSTQRSAHRWIKQSHYYSCHRHKSCVLDFEHEVILCVFE